MSSLLSSGKFTREKEGFPLPCLEGVVLHGEGAEPSAGATLNFQKPLSRGPAWRDARDHGLQPSALGRTWQGYQEERGDGASAGMPAGPSPGFTREDPEDEHQFELEAQAGTCWSWLLEGPVPEQPLCQGAIPRFMLPTSPLLHTHTFRFHIKKRHKTHSFLGFR